VGSKAQLFVDRILVREARGIVFTLHPAEKHPDNPLIRADRPWEGWRIVSYGTVLYDEDDSSAGYIRAGDAGEAPLTLYAISEDGVSWEKPLAAIPSGGREQYANRVEERVTVRGQAASSTSVPCSR